MAASAPLTISFRLLIVFQLFLAAGVNGANDARVAGAYVFGHEVRSFQPCGSSRLYWVKAANSELAARLRRHHEELGARPYGRIYVIVSGKPSGQKTTGFAQSFDGYFEISQVYEAAVQIPLDCGIL